MRQFKIKSIFFIMGNINKMCAGAGKQFDTDSCRQQFSGFVIFVVRNSVMEDSGYLT